MVWIIRDPLKGIVISRVYIYIYIPAPSKGWCLNPKELFSGTPYHPFGTPWRVQVYIYISLKSLKPPFWQLLGHVLTEVDVIAYDGVLSALEKAGQGWVFHRGKPGGPVEGNPTKPPTDAGGV